MADEDKVESVDSTNKGFDLNALKEKMRLLHSKRIETEKKNYDIAVQEDQLKRNNSQLVTMKRKREGQVVKKFEDEMKAEEMGIDYDRLKSLETSAEYANKVGDHFKRKKQDRDTGFASFDEAGLKQYKRVSSAIKPNFESYNKMKEVIGDSNFYPTADTITNGTYYPSALGMQKLVETVDQQEKKRREYHRRRIFDPDATVDYINEKNRKFNEKLEKYYGEYTRETKESIERGTAL
uniref:Pre-mRNA-splicing factor SYF2 n=1 Tax=Rhabditophanes sp. KR3021 TaxID=114890 RepID=A0AC35UGE1_9BILA